MHLNGHKLLPDHYNYYLKVKITYSEFQKTIAFIKSATKRHSKCEMR